MTKSAAAVEYTDCTSAEGQGFPNECPESDTKQSEGEFPVMQELWKCGVPLPCHGSQAYSDPEW